MVELHGLFGGVVQWCCSVRGSLSCVDSAVSAGAKCVGSRTMCISANARKKMIKMECETDNHTAPCVYKPVVCISYTYNTV